MASASARRSCPGRHLGGRCPVDVLHIRSIGRQVTDRGWHRVVLGAVELFAGLVVDGIHRRERGIRRAAGAALVVSRKCLIDAIGDRGHRVVKGNHAHVFVRDVRKRRSDGPAGRDVIREQQEAIVPLGGEYEVAVNERVGAAPIRD